MAGLLFVLLLFQCGFGALGAWLMDTKGRSAAGGFFLGFLLSGPGVIVAAVIPRSDEQEARRAVLIARAVAQSGNAQVLPATAVERAGRVPQQALALPRARAADILNAASSAPYENVQNLLRTVEYYLRDLGNPAPVAYCFGRPADGVPRVVFVDSDRLMVAKGSGATASSTFHYADPGCHITATFSAPTVIDDLTVGGLLLTDLHPSAAACALLETCRRIAWIDVVTNQPPAPAAQAPPTTEQTGEPRRDSGDPVEIVRTLKRMLDEGLIDDAEYNIRRSAILDGLA